MSQLRVSGQGQQDFFLNVLSFDAPVYGEMNAAQTRTQIQYFPIKAMQPELVVNVIFRNEGEWQNWQTWIRQNMINTQNSNATGQPGVTLNWPERNINNWTAIVGGAKAGGMRRNYTPRTAIEFQLVVSLVSQLGIFGSFGSNWQGLFGNTVVGANLDALLTLPENFLGGSTTAGNASILSGSGATQLLSQAGAAITSLIPGLGGF